MNLYGEWLLLSAIPVYLSMSDLGFGSVAANQMTMLMAKGDKKSALEVFNSVFILICLLSVALATLLVILTNYLPWGEWFNFSKLGHSDITYVIVFLGLYVLLGLQLSLLEASFRCDGNYSKGTFFLALLRLLESSIMFLSVLLGGGVVVASLSLLISRIIGIAILRLLLKGMSPWIVYGYKHAKINHIRQLAAPALSYMALPMGNALSIQGMVMVIGAILGPSSVVLFSVMRTVSRVALQGMGVINHSFWPELSIAFGKGDIKLSRSLHRISCKLSFWLSNLLILILLISSSFLVRLWTNDKVEIKYDLFIIMLVIIFANSFWYTSSVVHTATNQHQKMALLYFLGTSLSLLLATILLPVMGLNGAAISLLIVDFIMIGYVLIKSLHLTDDRFTPFFRQLFLMTITFENIKGWFEKLISRN